MAVVKAFRGWRYRPVPSCPSTENPQTLVVPPYDVISPDELKKLKNSSPYNFSHIILPEGGDKHQKAAALFRKWCEEKVLVQETKPSFYFYRQEFSLKTQEMFCQPQIKNSKTLSRTGILCRVGLEDYSKKIILPHEKTFSGPKADRYNLMSAAQGNMEPVFLGYDSPSFSGDEFNRLTESVKPVMNFKDGAAVTHSLWLIDDEVVSKQIEKTLSDKKFYILDGHHRYETALQFYKDHKDKDKRASLGFVLANICSFRQPGTVILPTHRVVKGLQGIHSEKIFEVLEKNWTVSRDLSLAQVESALLISRGASFGMRLSGEKGYAVLAQKNEDPSRLDLEVLHWDILPALATLRSKSFAEEEISYLKDIADLEGQVDAGEFQVGFLVRPSTSEEVMRVAEAGKTMPHKSTFFFPKIPSGLVINTFE